MTVYGTHILLYTTQYLVYPHVPNNNVVNSRHHFGPCVVATCEWGQTFLSCKVGYCRGGGFWTGGDFRTWPIISPPLTKGIQVFMVFVTCRCMLLLYYYCKTWPSCVRGCEIVGSVGNPRPYGTDLLTIPFLGLKFRHVFLLNFVKPVFSFGPSLLYYTPISGTGYTPYCT